MPWVPCLAVAAFLSLVVTSRAVRSQDVAEELAKVEVFAHHHDNSSVFASGSHAEFTARTGHALQAQLMAGHVLNGQYELKQFLGRIDAYGRNLAPPKVGKFPAMQAFTSKKHLGSGSFGDAWLAHDKARNKDVAVKIFFKGNYYLTPQLVAANNWESEVKGAADECQKIIALMKDSALYPKGAQHICACYEAHTTDTNPDGPLYLVQEMCGDSFFDLFVMNLHNPSSFTVKHPKLAKDPKWMMKAIAGTLEGVKFLSKLGYSHHDLKLENTVVREDSMVKLIDFGGLITKTAAKTQGGVCTPVFTPKEVKCGYPPAVAPDAPMYSFDDYSVGMMLFEVLCESRDHQYFGNRGDCGPGKQMALPAGVSQPNAVAVLKLAQKLINDQPSSRPDPGEAAKELRQMIGITG